jgi:integrase
MKPSTVGRRLAAVRCIHTLEGHDLPMSAALKAVLSGIRRAHGVAPSKKSAATFDLVRRMVDACGQDLVGKRDRAILLLGFATALRRGELAGLELSDLVERPEGLLIRLRRSKTDQEGRGQSVAVPHLPEPRYCAVAALDAWVSGARLEDGLLFRRFFCNGSVGKRALSSRTVANIIKRQADLIGEDPAQFSGHSLRAGYATTAARLGHDALRIGRQPRHVRLDSVQGYVCEADAFTDHPLLDLFPNPPGSD